MKVAISLLLVGLLLVPTTGCGTYTTAQVVSGVTKVDNVIQGIEAQLPSVQLVVNAFKGSDPEVYEYIEPILEKVGPALNKIHTACVVFEQNPGNDNYQVVLNAVDALVSQWDQAAMQLVGIKNPHTREQAALWTATVLTSLHVGLGILEQYATKKQVNAVPPTTKVSFKQFINRDQARQELVDAGYKNPDIILEAYGL